MSMIITLLIMIPYLSIGLGIGIWAFKEEYLYYNDSWWLFVWQYFWPALLILNLITYSYRKIKQ